ncbi:hypothetical protein F8271_10355 [Micromonospora sp. ALFpr18c]|uniref:hypothetical protein n=1 Tax=Micromonospora sp. ALFpr18c TaxID=1458665 RepID=UPI00124B65D4|nr:hypothetical protein [Micromonospora sp. ALFpr18c]KAB1943162.1 hypothetical protein F8271_10355 [Micromonospora sp. ALFpr18c]
MTDQRTEPVPFLDIDVPVTRWETAQQAMTCPADGTKIRPGDQVAVLLNATTVCVDCVEVD